MTNDTFLSPFPFFLLCPMCQCVYFSLILKPMNKQILLISFLALLSQGICFAQPNPAKVVEDFKPSSVNQQGKQFSRVNSERSVRTSISAPEAKKVQLDIGGVKYDLVKDDKGV